MRKLIILAFMLLGVCASPAAAADIFIGHQAGQVGSCEDNSIASPSFADFHNLNFGGTVTSTVGSTVAGGSYRTIQRYDITLIPDNAIIVGAEIVMEATALGSLGGDTVSLYQIAPANYDWVEGTADAATQSGSSCWNDKAWENITEWQSPGLSTAGDDYINTKLASDQAISTTGTKTFALNAAGIAALQGQLSDNDFEVIFYNLTTTANYYVTFASSENATAGNRPYLKVTYIVGAQVFTLWR